MKRGEKVWNETNCLSCTGLRRRREIMMMMMMVVVAIIMKTKMLMVMIRRMMILVVMITTHSWQAIGRVCFSILVVSVSLSPVHTCCSVTGRTLINNSNNNNRIERRYSRFFTIFSQRWELSPTCTRNRVQITCNTSSAYHVQVLCYVPLGTKGQLSY